MNSEPIVRQKSSAGQGNSVVHIGTGSLSKLQFDLPPLPEQEAIAEHLEEVDGTILNLQAQLIHLQTEKSALMQQLLTGKRRVKVAEVAHA